MKKVVEVYKTKDMDTPFGVYKNQLTAGDGRDVAIVWFFDKWSWKDEETKFPNKYEDVHGDQSWRYFMREWEAVTDGLQVELRTYEADMSGGDPTVEVPTQ